MSDFVKPFNAIFEFIGVTPQPTFAFFDVFKNPNIEEDLQNYRDHLNKHI